MTFTPVQPSERSPLPDLLRGLAILGILFVNMQDFAGYDEWRQHGADRAAQLVVDLFFNGRFISIFAMLFGAGAAFLLARNGAGVLVRRLAVLYLLGAAHFILIWHGDIISLYAPTALLLLVALLPRRLPPWVLVLGAALLAGYWLWMAAVTALEFPAGARYSFVTPIPPGTSYPALAQLRAHIFGAEWWDNLNYNLPWLLALQLLGAAMQRAGVLTRPQEHRPLLRVLAVGGLLTGVPLGLLLVWLNTQGSSAAGLWAVPVRLGGGLLMGLGYLGVLGLLVSSGRVGFWRVFAAPGRLALSNYLAQSVLMTAVFYPYGLGLYQRVGAAVCLLLAALLGAVQLALSTLILRRFRSGPAEWLLRKAVYGWRSGRPADQQHAQPHFQREEDRAAQPPEQEPGHGVVGGQVGQDQPDLPGSDEQGARQLPESGPAAHQPEDGGRGER